MRRPRGRRSRPTSCCPRGRPAPSPPFGQSEPAGAAGDAELAYGRDLCERGYAVLCPDRFPFESRSLERSPLQATFDGFRIFLRDAAGGELERTEDLYAGCVSNRLLFHGGTALGRTLWELRRAVDVLAARPEVDPRRLGVIGHSAGGAAWRDGDVPGPPPAGRLRVLRQLLPALGLRGGGVAPAASAPSPPPGLARYGDVDGILAGLAPSPYLESGGDVAEGDARFAETHARARARYAEFGVPERYEAVVDSAGHVPRRDMRLRAYAWLDRRLAVD